MISDEDGNVLASQELPDMTKAAYAFQFPASGRYMKVHQILTEEEYFGTLELPEATVSQTGDTHVYNTIPRDGCAVTSVYVEYADGYAESAGGTPEIGQLSYDEDGNVCFWLHDSGALDYNNNRVVCIQFHAGDALIYEARDPEGVGYFFQKDGTYLFRASWAEKAEEAPDDATIPPDENGAVLSDLVPLLPDHGAKVYRAEIWSPSVGTVIKVESDTGALGEVFLNSEGFLVFRCEGIFDSGFDTCFIRLIGENDQLLFESYDRSAEIGRGQAVGKFVYDPDGKLIFTTDLNYGMAALSDEGLFVEEPEEQPEMPTMVFEMEPIAETMVPTEESIETTAATEPVVAVPTAHLGDGMEVANYYDSESGQRMYALYTYEPIPVMFVEVQLAEGAFRYEHEWVLVRLLYSVKDHLPFVLGGCLLLFAILMVYLCCAAGKRPGTKEVRPGGLNAMPLEIYAFLATAGVAVLAVLGYEGCLYFVRQNVEIAILCGGLSGYVAALLIVAFLFACAAQFKTPGGYWWRKSLVGRCLTLVPKGGKLVLRAVEWLIEKWDSRLWPGIKKLGLGLWSIAVVLLKKIRQWAAFLLQKAGKVLSNLGQRFRHFFGLLPLTWQWLLAGFAMFLLMALVYNTNGEELLVVLCIGVCLGLILYGAHCFGTLLDSTKRMSKGDLEEKVDDKLMVGSFKDFAEELNGLADVAVVAAQKQLKSERMKTELITNVSHDIKTPLTSIINYVDLLQKPHTEAEQEKYLEVLDRQSQRLKKLIDDLMEMSKASTGNMSVEISRVDAAEAVNQALGEFADKLDKARLYPVFRQPEKPVTMMADGRLVWRVMSNLLSNAVKYALPGTRLYIDLQQVDSKVILSMKNISREELNMEADELLERFVRGDASRNTEGSGLGLNIARSLMELQKGQLQILVDGDLFKVTLIFPGE